MKNATMLYKAPGPHRLHGVDVDYVVVDEDEIEQHQADGWHLTPTDAQAALYQAQADGAPTRPELEAQAAELGLTFDRRLGDKKLADLIASKLAEQKD